MWDYRSIMAGLFDPFVFIQSTLGRGTQFSNLNYLLQQMF